MLLMQFINTLDVTDGGPARNSFELNRALNRLPGTRAQLVSFRGSRETSVLAEAPNTDLPSQVPRWLFGPRRTLTVFQMLRMLRRADAVIIHGYYLSWIAPLVLLARFTNTSIYVTPHGSLTGHQQKSSPAKKRIYEVMVGAMLRRSLDSFVVGSEVERRDLERLFPGTRCFVGGVGTALPSQPAAQEDRHFPLRLLSVSRLTPKKNIDVMLRSTRILMDRGVPVQLTVAGTGKTDYEASLRRLAVELGLSGTVTFAGSVTGTAKSHLFLKSDMFLLPSDDENFGIGVAEALAHGVPVVATRAVAAASVINGPAGRLIDAPDPEELADAIVSMSGNEPYKDARLAAIRVAHENFEWASVARRWMSGISRSLGSSSD
jgi:glycosyltransferase involved in cell wall biosynthesis